MRAKNKIHTYTGRGFDLLLQGLGRENINIDFIYKIIDANVSAFHPYHPLFTFFNNDSIVRYKFIEKFKIILLVLDLICDSEKIELDEEE